MEREREIQRRERETYRRDGRTYCIDDEARERNLKKKEGADRSACTYTQESRPEEQQQ